MKRFRPRAKGSASQTYSSHRSCCRKIGKLVGQKVHQLVCVLVSSVIRMPNGMLKAQLPS